MNDLVQRSESSEYLIDVHSGCSNGLIRKWCIF